MTSPWRITPPRWRRPALRAAAAPRRPLGRLGIAASSRSRSAATSFSRAMTLPVPAGISRPTITFSLSPAGLDPAGHRRLGQDARRLLERGRRDERVGLQARLGDALQYRVGDRRPQPVPFRLDVLLIEFGTVDLFAGEEGGLAGFLDLHLLQHLAHDHFDVLVVDAHALQPIDLLDLVDQVAGELLDPQDAQDVVRHPAPSSSRSPLIT